MSWTFGTHHTVRDAASGLEAGKQHFLEEQASYGNTIGDATMEQIDAAIEAANVLLESGAVGGPTAAVNVTLSGHANAGHKPAEGWANDTITVSVSQIT